MILTGFHGPVFHLHSVVVSQCRVPNGFGRFLHNISLIGLLLSEHLTSRVEYPSPQPFEHYILFKSNKRRKIMIIFFYCKFEEIEM